MAQTVDNSLEGRLGELESQVRALRTANWTDRASVVNASGEHVALAQLAFGQVTAEAAGEQTWTAGANVAGSTGWIEGDPAARVSLDVYVTGGRLRVDLAASFYSVGRLSETALSHGLFGPAATQAGLDTAPLHTGARQITAASISADDQSGSTANACLSNFALHTGLVAGWYRIASRYRFIYEADPLQHIANVSGARLAATPY